MATITGTTENDEIRDLASFNHADTIEGLAGDDTIYGLGGADLIIGGSGHDSLVGDSWNDTIQGGNGNDRLFGEGGDDRLYGGTGDDYVFTGRVSFLGGGRAFGGDGDDTVAASDGEDIVLDGGDGIDLAALWWVTAVSTGDVRIDFSGAVKTATAEFYTSATLRDVERLFAYLGTGDHRIVGSALADEVRLASYSEGTSRISLGAGDDRAEANAGHSHVLRGGGGHDQLMLRWNGPGDFLFSVDSAAGTADDGLGTTITGFEDYAIVSAGAARVAFGDGDDSFYGGWGADSVLGGDGTDLFYSSRGNDSLYGGDDDDILFGGQGDDLLEGGAGIDWLQGGVGADTVYGGDGDDLIRAHHAGNDTWFGGAGADGFVFAKTQTGDHLIMDFQTGVDRLRFAQSLLQFPPGLGPLDPDLLGFGAASGSAAQFVLIYDADADQTRLVWDPNGDDPAGGVYALCRFDGEVAVAASDISIIL